MLAALGSAPVQAKAPLPTVLLYPASAGDVPALVDLRTRLRLDGVFQVLTYDPDSASVRRVAAESSHPEWLVAPALTDDSRLALARALGVAFYIVVSPGRADDGTHLELVETAPPALTFDWQGVNRQFGARALESQAQAALTQEAAAAPNAPVPVVVASAALPPPSPPLPVTPPPSVPAPEPAAPVAPPAPVSAPPAPVIVPVPVIAPAPVPVPVIAPIPQAAPPLPSVILPVPPLPVPAVVPAPAPLVAEAVAATPEPAPVIKPLLAPAQPVQVTSVPQVPPSPVLAPPPVTPIAPEPPPAVPAPPVPKVEPPTVAAALKPAPVITPSAVITPKPPAPVLPMTGPLVALLPPRPLLPEPTSPPPAAPVPPPAAPAPVFKPQAKAEDLAAVKPLLTKGDAALEGGDVVGSISLYRQAVNEAPLSVVPRLKLAQAYQKGGLTDKALDEAKRALEIAPDNLPVQQFLTDLDQQNGNSDGSLARYQALVERNPDDSAAHSGLGEALWNSGDLLGAEAEYLTAKKLAPAGDHSANSHLARLYATQARYDDCLAALQDAGKDGYALAIQIVRNRADTLSSTVESCQAAFTAGKSTREQFYDGAKKVSAQAQALAGFVAKITPPSEYKLSHLHRMLSTNLLAQEAALLVTFIETGDAGQSESVAKLDKAAQTEMLTAQATEEKLGLWEAKK